MTISTVTDIRQRREAYRVEARVILLGMGPLPQRDLRRQTPRWQRVSLSPKGVGVRTRRPLSPGQIVFLDMVLPAAEQHVISCTATVADNHPLPDGSFRVGLAFHEMDSEDVVRIERFSSAVQRQELRLRARQRAGAA